MQHIDNDMEELFHRAGKDYQLREAESAWPGIFERITRDNSRTISSISFYNKARRFIHALMPLLLASAFFTLLPKSVTDCLTQANKAGNAPKQKNATILNHRAFDLKNNQQALKYNKADYLPLRLTNNAENEKRKAGLETKHEENYTTAFSNENNNAEIQNTAPGDADIRTISAIPVQQLDSKLPSRNKAETDSNKMDKQEPRINKTKGKKAFYMGIAGAVEFSKVGSMTPAKQGVAAGIVLGYSVNSRFSFESGLVLATKKYKSKGSDFSLDKIGENMPGGTVIDDLESKTTIIEIPLKLKYNIARKSNANFFVTGGLSAYIVTREKNRYNVSVNGAPEKMTGDYVKNNYKIPAVAILSTGYEHKISRYFQIRMEPFLKIPLQGIGVGSLRVKSAGLQIGIIARPK